MNSVITVTELVNHRATIQILESLESSKEERLTEEPIKDLNFMLETEEDKFKDIIDRLEELNLIDSVEKTRKQETVKRYGVTAKGRQVRSLIDTRNELQETMDEEIIETIKRGVSQ